MQEIKNDIIGKYSYKNYIIYIKETGESYEYYLQNEKYGVIYMIYGVDKEKNTLEELLQICAENIDNDIIFYKQRFEDKDL